MIREIREEIKSHWFSPDEKVDVIYENGERIGEIRHEIERHLISEDEQVDRTYNNRGELISETKHEIERHLISEDEQVDRTYNRKGEIIRETKKEIQEHLFSEDEPVDRTYNKKGYLIQEKRYLHEEPKSRKNEDVKGVSDNPWQERQETIEDKVEDYYENPRQETIEDKVEDYYENEGSCRHDETSVVPENVKVEKKEKIRLPRFYINENTTSEEIRNAMFNGEYSGVEFVSPEYAYTYKCNRCGKQWKETSRDPLDDFAKCRYGCRMIGELPPLSQVIYSLFTKTPVFGTGRLINKSKKSSKK